jgi:hypothetical protein
MDSKETIICFVMHMFYKWASFVFDLNRFLDYPESTGRLERVQCVINLNKHLFFSNTNQTDIR